MQKAERLSTACARGHSAMPLAPLPIISALVWVVLALAALTGCQSTTAVLAGSQLALGHYYIQSQSDDVYHYDQYFVALPDNHWEFVEYGYKISDRTSVCQLVRRAGTYTLGDSTITSTLTASGDPLTQCGLTKAQFQAYAMTNAPDHPVGITGIRNITDTGFDGKDMFVGVTGWKHYTKVADPFGFY